MSNDQEKENTTTRTKAIGFELFADILKHSGMPYEEFERIMLRYLMSSYQNDGGELSDIQGQINMLGGLWESLRVCMIEIRSNRK